jgi:hypothetical protein
MSGARKDVAPSMFPAGANATPVDRIAPPSVDPRRARVSKVHEQIAKGVKDGTIYRPR